MRKLSTETGVSARPHGVHQICPYFSEGDYKDYVTSSSENSGYNPIRLVYKLLMQERLQQRGISQPTISDPNVDSQHYRDNCNPAIRLAFLSRLDRTTNLVQDMQVIVQQFYECRVASLERFLAFCVMFHAMSVESNKLWIKAPFDTSRSQSNLKVATTAAPIFTSASSGSEELSSDLKATMKTMQEKLIKCRFYL